MKLIENASLLLGRLLLRLNFIIPGISKINGYAGTATYMHAQNVPLITLLLPLTILIQIAGGTALIVGYQGKFVAFILAG